MKKSSKYISYLLCLITVQLFAQIEYAYIETNFETTTKKKSYSVEVNGIHISQTELEFKIPINELGYDTIRYSTSNNDSNNWAIMKLKPNSRYEVKSNSCSFYTIKPKVNPKQGMVQFIINSQDTSSYLVGIAGFDRRINRNSIDKFYYTPPSVMCPYSAKPIAIKTHNKEILKKINFHFLHGELVGVKFNKELDTIELDLYGCIKDESDYKYLSDKIE